MADKNRVRQIEEKLRQALEKLGRSLEEIFGNQQRPQLQPVPIPVDRPHRNSRRFG